MPTARPESFGELVRHVALRFHSKPGAETGALAGISRTLQCPPALIPWWASGVVKSPKDQYLKPFCEKYDLDYWGVRALIIQSPNADPFGGSREWRVWYQRGCPAGSPDAAQMISRVMKRVSADITKATEKGGGLRPGGARKGAPRRRRT